MFIKNVHGQENINAAAQSIGCVAGETLNYKNKYSQSGRPGLTGNTFAIKDQLKAAGARWDGDNKAWTFESWKALESALNNVIGA